MLLVGVLCCFVLFVVWCCCKWLNVVRCGLLFHVVVCRLLSLFFGGCVCYSGCSWSFFCCCDLVFCVVCRSLLCVRC